MGDFNINIKSSNSDKDKLENFYDLFNLTNLAHSETCFMKNSKSIIDLILTNKPLHFQKTHVVETGLSEYHKIISTFFKASSSKLKTKVIYYKSYKKFNESDFLYWVEPSAENKAAYKKQRNKCVKIRRKSIKRYMDKVSEKGIETKKVFGILLNLLWQIKVWLLAMT